MQPVSPVLQGYNLPETNFAENQPEYRPLPAVRTNDGLVLSRWELSKEELQALVAGKASLFMFVWLTVCSRCGEAQPLTPILPEITTAKEIMERASAQKRAETGKESAPGNGRGQEQPETLLSQLESSGSDPAPPSDEEIATAFKELWQSQIGRPGYRERRWRNLRELLRRRGIVV